MANKGEREARTTGAAESLAKLALGTNSKPELDVNQVGRGTHACYRNAVSLSRDARALARSGSVSRAVSMVILSMEELSKVANLHDRYADTLFGGEVWDDFWNDYFYYHTDKLRSGVEYAKRLHQRRVRDGGWSLDRHPSGFRVFFPDESVRHLNIVKQRGFYTDFVNGEFVAPSDRQEDFAVVLDPLLAFAEERCDAFARRHITVKRSLRTAFRTWELVRRARQEFGDGAKYDEDRMREIWRECQSVELPDDEVGPTDEELAADCRTALFRNSAEEIPDYLSFERWADGSDQNLDDGDLRRILTPICCDLRLRLEAVETLPVSGWRAYRMSKLLLKWLIDCRSWPSDDATMFVFHDVWETDPTEEPTGSREDAE